MKNKARVIKIKNAEGNSFRVHAIDSQFIEGFERLIKVFPYKEEADPNDKYWGEETAKREAIEFAHKWENLGEGNEEIIYQTPE